MSNSVADAESTVSGNQANIPARIRHKLDIEDGDHLRWKIRDDGTLHVEVVQQREGTFAEFDGYEGAADTDAVVDHDDWGVE